MKDIPMYLSKKTKDSIRNRYSHSVEVGLGTEYIVNHVSRGLGNDIDLNFFKIAKITGLVHDIGHTAFSHDGEAILDKVLQKASLGFDVPVRFNANMNNFRRIEKYGLFDLLPEDIRRYALASLLKRKKDLREYPEYLSMEEDLHYAIDLEEEYLASKGMKIHNRTGKTILCQAMDLADENRYRVTDIIDALNIYSKQKLKEILVRSLKSKVRIKDIRKLVTLNMENPVQTKQVHSDKMPVKALLVLLLDRESHAKTEFQNIMNSLSMAFNRNFMLSEEGKLVPADEDIEQLRRDFQTVAATYIWGSKKVENIKKPFRHYFSTVVNYFVNGTFNMAFIDSSTYREEFMALKKKALSEKAYRKEELLLLRNFLGGLTNVKIIELYKKIKLERFEAEYACQVEKKEKLLLQTSMHEFEKKLEKYTQRVILKAG